MSLIRFTRRDTPAAIRARRDKHRLSAHAEHASDASAADPSGAGTLGFACSNCRRSAHFPASLRSEVAQANVCRFYIVSDAVNYAAYTSVRIPFYSYYTPNVSEKQELY